jgi:hypothetical protein
MHSKSISGPRSLGTGAKRTISVTLTDETGRSLHEAEVAGGSFALPDSMQLAEGRGYTWQVSARLADGRRYIGAGDFRIATADLQGRARELRPADSAPVSERVAYAAWRSRLHCGTRRASTGKRFRPSGRGMRS